jgi:hypothetical protein
LLVVAARGIVTALLAHGTAAAKLNLNNVKDIVSIIGTIITVLAIIIGGFWAYFKFARGRTYRPRLEVGLTAQWWAVNEKWLLHARVTVKNVGVSKVELLQTGTGLRANVLAADQPSSPASAE